VIYLWYSHGFSWWKDSRNERSTWLAAGWTCGFAPVFGADRWTQIENTRNKRRESMIECVCWEPKLGFSLSFRSKEVLPKRLSNTKSEHEHYHYPAGIYKLKSLIIYLWSSVISIQSIITKSYHKNQWFADFTVRLPITT